MLAGLALVGGALALASLMGAGWQDSAAYLGVLLGFARTTTGATGAMQLRLWKYVDLNSFFQLLFHGRSSFHWALFAALGALPLVCLIRQWRRLPESNRDHIGLVWAATLTWTPILNLYVGIYDTLVVVPGAFLVAAVLADGAESRRQRAFALLIAAAYVAPWVSQPLARSVGIQFDTLAIAAVGVFDLLLAMSFVPYRPPAANEGTLRGQQPRVLVESTNGVHALL
jgi:hypothetical protein